jgi:acyl carrier protein
MHDLTTGLITILRKYMRDPTARVLVSTPLSELGIDDLDVPMICLDIEDLYGVHIVATDALGDIETLGHLTAGVIAALAAKARPRARKLRRKSSWMSTGA